MWKTRQSKDAASLHIKNLYKYTTSSNYAFNSAFSSPSTLLCTVLGNTSHSFMASITFPTAGKSFLQSFPPATFKSNSEKVGPLLFERDNISYNKCCNRNLTAVNIATRLPVIVPPQPEKETSSERNLAAWTSIRQERWEGELTVEGEIPKWLVCTNYALLTT